MSEEKAQDNENKPAEGSGEKNITGEGAEEKKTTSVADDRKAAAEAKKAARDAEKAAVRQRAADLSPKKPVAVDEQGSIWMSRRNFFSRAGWVAFFSFLGSMLIGSLRFMFPRVLFEPSPRFKAGYPDDYPVGSVTTKWVKEKRVWVIRNEQGIYAIFAQCTHLGCTPRWLDAENKFKCPCHGSGFTREGVNFEGPAPRPLERVEVALAEDGQIIIDKSVKFLEEKGDWGKPGSILRV